MFFLFFIRAPAEEPPSKSYGQCVFEAFLWEIFESFIRKSITIISFQVQQGHTLKRWAH